VNKKVLLFAPQGFEDIEVATFTNILGWTRILKEVKSIDVVIIAFKKHISSKHGLTIKSHILLDKVEVNDYQALIIPGGHNDSGYEEVYDKKVQNLIRTIYKDNGIIVSMCVGSLPVAKSGILQGKKATTYTSSKRHDNLKILESYGAIPVNARIAISDRIITNRGPDAAIDVAFTLIEMLNGKEDMKRIKKAMMFK
jgi:4-methyl-5(b-hydroxyethyl)-thiazole monophosphate biosynthesis